MISKIIFAFEIYQINEEISHSEIHFYHPGSSTRIPYLHCADNRMQVSRMQNRVKKYKSKHNTSPQIFFGQ